MSGEVYDGLHVPGVYLPDVERTLEGYERWWRQNVAAGLEYWDIPTQIVVEYLHNITLEVYMFHPKTGDMEVPECRLDKAHRACRAALYPILDRLEIEDELYWSRHIIRDRAITMKLLFYSNIEQRLDRAKHATPAKRRKTTKGKQAGSSSSEAAAHYDLIVNIA